LITLHFQGLCTSLNRVNFSGLSVHALKRREKMRRNYMSA